MPCSTQEVLAMASQVKKNTKPQREEPKAGDFSAGGAPSWCVKTRSISVGCLTMLCTPNQPNGFADQTIPMKNGYFIGKLYPIFRQTHLLGWL